MRFHHHLYDEQDPDICLQIWSTITMQLPGMDHKGGLRFLPWSLWWWWWSYWSWWWSSGCCSGDKPWLHGGDGEQPRLLGASLWGWDEPASCQGDLMLNSFAWFIWNGVDPPFIEVKLPKPRFKKNGYWKLPKNQQEQDKVPKGGTMVATREEFKKTPFFFFVFGENAQYSKEICQWGDERA